MPSAPRRRRSTSPRTRLPSRRSGDWRATGWAMGELDALRIRDEVLQAMYWMRSEGIDDTPSARELARFLAVPAETLQPYLERFVRDGYLEPLGGGFGMTSRGEASGK